VFTALHRALGLDPTASLIYDMVEQAVTERITELEDLDWKREIPHKLKPGRSEEICTDFSAMANSGGGMIVYGVAEDRATRPRPASPMSARPPTPNATCDRSHSGGSDQR
jgi:hypothetical protein